MQTSQQNGPQTGSRGKPPNAWYGYTGQFYPWWVIYEFFHALFSAIWNTLRGLVLFIAHPIRSCKDIWYAVTHLGALVETIIDRSKHSVQRHGIVFTAFSLFFMFVLPGAGVFGHVAEASEHGRKTRLRAAQGSAIPGVTPNNSNIQTGASEPPSAASRLQHEIRQTEAANNAMPHHRPQQQQHPMGVV